jgi:hypothetical protein
MEFPLPFMALEDFGRCVNGIHYLLEKFDSVTVPCRHLLTMASKHLFTKSHLRGPVHPIANLDHQIFDGEMIADTTQASLATLSLGPERTLRLPQEPVLSQSPTAASLCAQLPSSDDG